MSRKSQKFEPSGWTEKLIPIVLALLTVILIATIVVIILSVTGILQG